MYLYICSRKLHLPPFLQIVTGKEQKRTSFNFELFLCIYVPENSIHPLSYSQSQESNKKEPILVLNYFIVDICPKTPSTPFLTTSHREVEKGTSFNLNYLFGYMCPKTPFTPFLTTSHRKVRKNYILQVFVILCHFYCG